MLENKEKDIKHSLPILFVSSVKANIESTVTWPVKALVEATPISGPT